VHRQQDPPGRRRRGAPDRGGAGAPGRARLGAGGRNQVGHAHVARPTQGPRAARLRWPPFVRLPGGGTRQPRHGRRRRRRSSRGTGRSGGPPRCRPVVPIERGGRRTGMALPPPRLPGAGFPASVRPHHNLHRLKVAAQLAPTHGTVAAFATQRHQSLEGPLCEGRPFPCSRVDVRRGRDELITREAPEAPD
jgi:hypothetical protein